MNPNCLFTRRRAMCEEAVCRVRSGDADVGRARRVAEPRPLRRASRARPTSATAAVAGDRTHQVLALLLARRPRRRASSPGLSEPAVLDPPSNSPNSLCSCQAKSVIGDERPDSSYTWNCSSGRGSPWRQKQEARTASRPVTPRDRPCGAGRRGCVCEPGQWFIGSNISRRSLGSVLRRCSAVSAETRADSSVWIVAASITARAATMTGRPSTATTSASVHRPTWCTTSRSTRRRSGIEARDVHAGEVGAPDRDPVREQSRGVAQRDRTRRRAQHAPRASVQVPLLGGARRPDVGEAVGAVPHPVPRARLARAGAIALSS